MGLAGSELKCLGATWVSPEADHRRKDDAHEHPDQKSNADRDQPMSQGARELVSNALPNLAGRDVVCCVVRACGTCWPLRGFGVAEVPEYPRRDARRQTQAQYSVAQLAPKRSLPSGSHAHERAYRQGDVFGHVATRFGDDSPSDKWLGDVSRDHGQWCIRRPARRMGWRLGLVVHQGPTSLQGAGLVDLRLHSHQNRPSASRVARKRETAFCDDSWLCDHLPAPVLAAATRSTGRSR